MYAATEADPIRNVYDRQNNRTITWRIPDTAVTTDGTDRHLNIADPAHSKVLEIFGAKRRTDGNWDAYVAIINDLRGAGVYSTWHGTRAYGGSSMGGLIRKGELTNGIPHALAIATGNMALNRNVPATHPAYLGSGKAFVWPASSADTGAMYSDIGNLHMGTLLAIPPSVDITKLGITDRRTLNLARALQDYGAYIVDTGGGDWFLGSIFYAELAAQNEAPGGPIPDIDKVTMLLRVVANNSSTNVGGGGTPRRSLAPPLATAAQSGVPPVALSPQPHTPGEPSTAWAIAAILVPSRRLLSRGSHGSRAMLRPN
jgi:hypothetical protein